MATTMLRSSGAARRMIAAGVAAGTLLTLAACSSTDPEDSASGTADTSAPTGTLEILVSSAAASDAAFEKINELFSAEYPDVNVKFSTVSNDNYPATESSRLTAGNLDIFVSKMRPVPDYAADSTPGDVLLAKAGQLVDLTGESFTQNFTPSVLDFLKIDDKLYAVPTGLSYSTGVYYNKTMFDEYGISVPTTWSELQDAVATLESNGETAFGMGGRDTWPAGLAMLGVVGSLYPTDQAKSDLAASLWAGDTALDSGTPVEVLDKTQWVFDHAQKNFSGSGYDEIPALFAGGDVAMTIDGTWNNPTILGAVDGGFEVGYFPFPGSDNAADNAYLNGKVELMLSVPENAPNKDAALAWLDFFSQPENYTEFVNLAGYSPAEQGIATSEFIDSIAPYTTEFRGAWDTIWFASNDAGQDAVYPFNYPALSPLGSSTASDAAAAAQKAWAAAF